MNRGVEEGDSLLPLRHVRRKKLEGILCKVSNVQKHRCEGGREMFPLRFGEWNPSSTHLSHPRSGET